MRATYLLGVLFFILCFSPLSQARESIPLATGEWAPFTTQQQPDKGFVTRLVNDVFSRMGVEADVSFYPWKRCYSMVLAGAAWGAFPYSWTEERASEVLFSDPISYSDTAWFHVDAPPLEHYEKLEDMKGVRIGGVAGYFYEEALRKANLEVEFAPDEVSIFRMLLAGRVDVVIMNQLVAQRIIREHFPAQGGRVSMLSGLYSRDKLRMIVSPAYPDARNLLEAFNAALREAGGPVAPPPGPSGTN